MRSIFKTSFYLIVILTVLFTPLLSCLANNIMTNNVSINLCANGSGENDVIHLLVENKSDDVLNFSHLEVFGNSVYVLKPNGEIAVSMINLDLPNEFIYKPDFQIKQGEIINFNSINADDAQDFLNPIVRNIHQHKTTGRHEIWFDLVNWMDFSIGKHYRYTSNRLIFYVGADGKRIFINNPEAVRAFQRHGVEFGNSADEVEVKRTEDGNYRLHKIKAKPFQGNSGWNLFDRFPQMGWGLLLLLASAIGYCICKRVTKRRA